jgi:cation diffusion facilitator CzcD-associated flavoprotein CzcO
VGQYLERYIEKYPGYTIQKNTRVVKSDFADGKWTVQTQNKGEQGQIQSHVFDHLIVATGFFGKPHVPKILDGFQAPVVHSSQVRDVKDLLANAASSSSNTSRKNIVVVGGQMSGVEIAAAIAVQLSSAENSPSGTTLQRASEYIVTHVVQNPVWIMPLFLPRDPLVEIAEGEKVM